MAGIENMDEFDVPCHMTAVYCNQLAEEDYEKQTVSETERALENLISYMEKNPQVYKKILKKKMKEEKENEGLFSFLKVKMMTLIKGEENVSFVSDRECDQRLEELKTGMSKAFDYNLESKGLRKSKRLAEKRQVSKSSINTAAPKAKGRQSKKRQTTAPNITETVCQKSGQDAPVAVPPPPPPPPPPVTPARQKSLPRERSRTERKAGSSGPLKELNHSNIQVTTPPSLKKKDPPTEMGSITSLASIGSLSSLHQELLSYNPMKRLKTTTNERSPGGTPVRPRPPLRDTPPVTPVNQADSNYRYWLNSLHNKFRNVLSPASDPQSPNSDPNSPAGSSPQ